MGLVGAGPGAHVCVEDEAVVDEPGEEDALWDEGGDKRRNKAGRRRVHANGGPARGARVLGGVPLAARQLGLANHRVRDGVARSHAAISLGAARAVRSCGVWRTLSAATRARVRASGVVHGPPLYAIGSGPEVNDGVLARGLVLGGEFLAQPPVKDLAMIVR